MTATARVLLIDDDTAVLNALRLLLEIKGHIVSSFSSAAQGLAWFEKTPQNFDLVLCDLKMPVVDGYGVLNRVREVSRTTPFILMSGHATSTEAKQAMLRGADAFLPKPFMPPDFDRLMQQLMPDLKKAMS